MLHDTILTRARQLPARELKLLQKGNTCISVIVPTHRLSPQRRVDRVEVERALNKAKLILQQQYPTYEVRPLLRSLDGLFNKIDFTMPAEGVGIFVSEEVQQLVTFHFEVQEKVMVTNSFEVRDVLYQLYYSSPYLVLHLTDSEARLYKGKLNTLKEIVNEHFPYLGSNAVRTTGRANQVAERPCGCQQVDDEQVLMQELNYKEFIKKVDEKLGDALAADIPLIVAGAKKAVSYFTIVSTHQNMVGHIYNNSTSVAIDTLAGLGKATLKLYRDRNKQNNLLQLEEGLAAGTAVTGLSSAWAAAQHGHGDRLLVDKDYMVTGYLMPGQEEELYLERVPGYSYVLPDAVNTLIETVLEKSGEVILLENSSLAEFGHIALIKSGE